MKRITVLSIVIILATVFFTSWNGLTIPRGTVTQELASFQGKNNVLRFQPSSNGYEWNIFSFSLAQYSGQLVEISMSAQVWLDTPAHIVWQVNDQNYKTIAGNFTPLRVGQWHTIQGTGSLTVKSDSILLLTSWNINNASGYIADLDIIVTPIIPEYDNNAPALHTKWPFPVGAAVQVGEVLPAHPVSGLLRHFNLLTAADILLPGMIMPSPWTPTSSYRWANTDELLNYAEANNKKVLATHLFYHIMTPTEFFRGSGIDGWVTKDELYARMEHHARTVFQKTRGRIEYWVVFNEVPGDNGAPRSGPGRGADSNMNLSDTLLHTSIYTQIMDDAGHTGMDRYEYVLKAFQFARRHADANGGQNVKLILNDYNIETNRAKQTEFLRLLDYLIANNAPIDGVGIQGHINYTAGRAYVRDLGRAIDVFSAKRNPITERNLMVYFTEPDISLYNSNETNWNNLSASKKTLTDRELNTRLAQQATLYRDLFNMLEQKYNQGKIGFVNIWGVADRESWLNWHPVQGRTDYPLLFDRNYRPKPAFHELMRGR